jgi:Ca2+-binding EF-hand superfamily protein
MRAEFQKMRAEQIAKYDTNKDGKLDDTERKALRDEKAAERFKALDTNGNGTLSLEEFKAGAVERKGHGGHRGGHR